MKSNYVVQGFRKAKRINKFQTTQARYLLHIFTGSSFDELEINATITNQKEMDDFISFLKMSRPCLE